VDFFANIAAMFVAVSTKFHIDTTMAAPPGEQQLNPGNAKKGTAARATVRLILPFLIPALPSTKQSLARTLQRRKRGLAFLKDDAGLHQKFWDVSRT
jgi:hypothetical protein